MRSTIACVLMAVTALACGDSAPQTETGSAAVPTMAAAPDSVAAETPPAPVGGNVMESTLENATPFAVELREWRVDLPDDTIYSGAYAIQLHNRGERAHTIEVRADHGARWRTVPIPPGSSATLSISLMPGTYRVESIDSAYAARGLRGTFVVVDR